MEQSLELKTNTEIVIQYARPILNKLCFEQ